MAAMGRICQTMVSAFKDTNLLRGAQAMKDLPCLIHRNKLILFSVDDHTIGNSGEKRKKPMFWKILKKGFFRERMAFGPFIRFEIIQVKRRGPNDDGPNLFFHGCPDERNIASQT
jgi:hypothetical protein